MPTDHKFKAIALSHGADTVSEHRSIKVSTSAILFFGTPHFGANGVELAKWLTKLLSVYKYKNPKLLKALSRDSDELEEIQESYLRASEHIKTITFFEEIETPIWGGYSELVGYSI